MVKKTELTLANCPLNPIHAVYTQINVTIKETYGGGAVVYSFKPALRRQCQVISVS